MHTAIGQLPGAVLVVGAGSSGAESPTNFRGRAARLSVRRYHERPPRRYRGRDFCWWLGVLGLWDATTRDPSEKHVTIAVSGAYGGRTIDFRRLAAEGVTLVGRAEGFGDGAMRFAPDLASNLAQGDANYLSFLDAADAYVAQKGLDRPSGGSEPRTGPACVTDPILAQPPRPILYRLGSGFALDFGWLKVGAFDNAACRPIAAA
jgi:putative flavoprotein involved in K+ transport